MRDKITDCKGDPIPDGLHEYAFDVKLFAVVRVVAKSRDDAVNALRAVLDAAEPSDGWIASYNDGSQVPGLRVTEVSMSEDGEDENREPFEIDGEPT